MTSTPTRRSARLLRAVLGCALGLAAALVAAPGCSSKMEEKECTKLKIESFDVLNKPQHCNNDGDCRGSVWPDCGKPLSNVNAEEVKKKSEAYFTGVCEEKKPECNDQTAIYCKQGLCARKEKGSPEQPGGTAPSDIIVQ